MQDFEPESLVIEACSSFLKKLSVNSEASGVRQSFAALTLTTYLYIFTAQAAKYLYTLASNLVSEELWHGCEGNSLLERYGFLVTWSKLKRQKIAALQNLRCVNHNVTAKVTRPPSFLGELSP